MDRNKFLCEQVDRLQKTGLPENISVAEVLLEMSISDRREIENRSIIILIHLLKFKVQPEKKSPSWISSIEINRDAIESIINESPSLKNYYTSDMIRRSWPRVLRVVSGVDMGFFALRRINYEQH